MSESFSMSTPSSSDTSFASVTVDDASGVGLSDPQLSQGRRRMLDLVNRLHSTGVQIDIDLPVIAVIGSQSAGKSSLIESISGITLPRASGTCTRCPTECRLSYSTHPWRCSVSIRRITGPDGVPLGEAKSERFGPIITDKAQVEDRIRRAQRAILNPRTSSQTFLEGDDEDPQERQLTFSRNCVCLEISGPDIADLSFVDLPGIIATEGPSGRRGDVELVENLVNVYIEKPSCLILLTVSCETDFENQGAFSFAQRFDPEGKRTIGVLTKPDRIPSGEESQWLPFIKNIRVPLTNGWFAVKQPDSKAIKEGITWSEARQAENDYFSSQDPWSILDVEYQRRLRTTKLTACLSQILSELITKRLPEIQQELQVILERTQKELRDLPKPPSQDPVSEVHQLLDDFARDVSRQVQGTVGRDGLIQRVNKLHFGFRQAIRRTAPDFRPYTRNDDDPPEMPIPEFIGGDDSQELENLLGRPIYIDDVCERMSDARTRELPDHHPFVVIENLVTDIIQQWEDPARELADDVHSYVSGFMDKLIAKHFAKYSAGGLQHHVTVVVVDHVRGCLEAAHGRIEWLLELEDMPFTLNTHYLADYTEKFRRYYKSVYESNQESDVLIDLHNYKPSENDKETQDMVDQALDSLRDLGIHTTVPSLAKLLPPTPDEHALQVMAEVRAYYQVAYKRFTDIVPLAVDRMILRGLDKGIRQALFDGLGLGGQNGPQTCAELLQEPSTVVARRTDLQTRRDRLSSAKRELMKMSMH